ncbi:MAG: ribonuclease III [Acidobacteria bacterium]|nr:ribonuclease III [Acidobacteriota bacterium]
MTSKLATLENLTGHKFSDLTILERAVTHRSWAFENMPAASDEEIRAVENESLEFVGDSVLGLAIAEQVFRNNPRLSEGDLTLMKHHLVSTVTLAKIAAEIEIGQYIRVGRGEEKTGGRKKQALLANTLEAIIGAIFFDGGYIKARAFVGKIFADEIKSATPKSSLDYKTMLQERLQAEKLVGPSYNVIRVDGPPHQRKFYVEAVWSGGKAMGEGRSIKAAEMMAANEALAELSGGGKHTKHAN